jgi:signal peptidase I
MRNGEPVNEPYLHDPLPGWPSRGIRPVELGPDELFVLGDNRDNSQDSRHTGPVNSAAIVGRAEFIALAFSGGVRWERFPTRLAAD